MHRAQDGDEIQTNAHFYYKVQCEEMEWKVDIKIVDASSSDHELLSKVFKESFEAWIWKQYFDFCAPLVFQDDLTHVYNYRKLVYDLQNLISANNQQERPTPFSLIFMDIDDLKKINNKYGHRTGSQLIRDLATKLRHDLTDEYIIYRYGGDEFILLVEGKDPQHVMQELELIQNRLSKNCFKTRHGHQLKLTFSLGVVQYPQHGISLEELIDLADSMMYHAKKVGGKKILTPEEFKTKTA
jgi:diguanylate cyclase (GGDEF)-like protein